MKLHMLDGKEVESKELLAAWEKDMMRNDQKLVVLPDGVTFEFPKLVERVQFRPGDVLVLHHPHRLSIAQRKHIRQHLELMFPDNKILVLEEGMRLTVAGPEPVADKPHISGGES